MEASLQSHDSTLILLAMAIDTATSTRVFHSGDVGKGRFLFPEEHCFCPIYTPGNSVKAAA